MVDAKYIELPEELRFILPKLHRFTYQPHVATPMEGGNERRRPKGPPIEYFGDQIRVDEATFDALKRLNAECVARRQLIALTTPDTSERVAAQFIGDPQSGYGVLEALQSATIIEGNLQTKTVILSFALQVVRRIPAS